MIIFYVYSTVAFRLGWHGWWWSKIVHFLADNPGSQAALLHHQPVISFLNFFSSMWHNLCHLKYLSIWMFGSQVHSISPASNHCLLLSLPGTHLQGCVSHIKLKSEMLPPGAEDWDDTGHLARRQHHDQWDQSRDAQGKISSKSLPQRLFTSHQVTYITMSDAWLYPITYYCCFCLFEFLIIQVLHTTCHLVWYST